MCVTLTLWNGACKAIRELKKNGFDFSSIRIFNASILNWNVARRPTYSRVIYFQFKMIEKEKKYSMSICALSVEHFCISGRFMEWIPCDTYLSILEIDWHIKNVMKTCIWLRRDWDYFICQIYIIVSWYYWWSLALTLRTPYPIKLIVAIYIHQTVASSATKLVEQLDRSIPSTFPFNLINS